MKEIFEAVELELIIMTNDDIIITSNDGLGDGDHEEGVKP